MPQLELQLVFTWYFIPTTTFTLPDYGKGAFLTLFVENQEKLTKTATKNITGGYLFTFILSAFYFTFQILL